MNSKDKLQIMNAILWAVAVIASSILLAGTRMSEKMAYILLSLWFCSFLMLSMSEGSLHSEWECLRGWLVRMLRRS